MKRPKVKVIYHLTDGFIKNSIMEGNPVSKKQEILIPVTPTLLPYLTVKKGTGYFDDVDLFSHNILCKYHPLKWYGNFAYSSAWTEYINLSFCGFDRILNNPLEVLDMVIERISEINTTEEVLKDHVPKSKLERCEERKRKLEEFKGKLWIYPEKLKWGSCGYFEKKRMLKEIIKIIEES